MTINELENDFDFDLKLMILTLIPPNRGLGALRANKIRATRRKVVSKSTSNPGSAHYNDLEGIGRDGRQEVISGHEHGLSTTDVPMSIVDGGREPRGRLGDSNMRRLIPLAIGDLVGFFF